MQDIDIKKVKSFLDKHDYIVKVYKSEEGCVVEFPYPKIYKPLLQQNKTFYILRYGNEPGVYVNNEFWSAPNYALRLMVTCDIINKMKKIPIHESLISYYNSDREVERLSDILMGPVNDDDKNKEMFLATLLAKAIENKFPSVYEEVANAREHNVGTGYRILKSFF